MPEIQGLRLAVAFSRISIEDCRRGGNVKATAFEIFGAILTLLRDGRPEVMGSLILRIVLHLILQECVHTCTCEQWGAHD